MADAVDWASVFEAANPRPGCSDADIRELLSAIARPLDDEEAGYLAEILARNPYRPGTLEAAGYSAPEPRSWP